MQSQTLGSLFLEQVARNGNKRAFRYYRNGDWQSTTWNEFRDRASAIASYFVAHDIRPGERICIIGKTCAEWCCADIGGHLAGVVTVGAYPGSSARQLAHLLADSDARVAFVEGEAELDKILRVRETCPTLAHIVVWDHSDLVRHDGVVSLADVLATPHATNELNTRLQSVTPDQTAILVYTSGTTGDPKGAIITHENILTCVRGLHNVFSVGADDEALSFLPMAHAAERILGFYGRVYAGLGTAFSRGIEFLVADFDEIKPTIFGCVPRVLEKAFKRIHERVAASGRMRRALFSWAIRVGRNRIRYLNAGTRPPASIRAQLAIADRIAFAKIRRAFGGRLRYLITGTAPIPENVLSFFCAAGVPLYEMYGMTESTVVTHCNRPGTVRLGSVGQPMDYVEDMIADDGEILVRGNCVFQGYHGEASVVGSSGIDDDGWLHTGDIGRKDDDGFLHVIDRKKNIIITSGGKNISPAGIEHALRAADPLISDVYVHGDRRHYLVALITIEAAEHSAWSRQRDAEIESEMLRLFVSGDLKQSPVASAADARDAIVRAMLADRVAAAVRSVNEDVSRVSAIKKFQILDRGFSISGNELTQTLKVRRGAIEASFASTIERLYSDSTYGISP